MSNLEFGIFLLSVLTPLFILIYAIFSTKTYRRINKNMHLFIGFLFLFLGIYTLFTLSINEFIFNLFGITAIVFTVLFSVLYLRHENPFSDHISMVYSTEKEMPHIENSPQPLPLFSTIETYLKEKHPYTDQLYNHERFSKILKQKRT